MNNSSLIFNSVFSVKIIIGVALPVFIFFVYREFQRKQKFLALRILALSLVMMSLLGLLLNPTYQEEKKSKEVILLTKGYQSKKVDSIIKKNPELKILQAKDAAPYAKSIILKSWYDLRDENIFFVVGQGLPGHALDLLRTKTFQFFPTEYPKGITKLIIPHNIYVNDRYRIGGTFNGSEKTRLKLIGPGGVEDSVTLNTGQSSFSLSFIPKQSGKFIYLLTSTGGSISSQRLPIEVLPVRQLRILFIQKFPTAEVRFLKNFLSEKNHEVIVRYQTSKGNFSYEYSNTPRMQLDALDYKLLNSFDLLFLDQKSYATFSLFEKSELNKSITAGLGVVFFLNDTKDNVLTELLHLRNKVDSKDTAHIHLLSPRKYALPVLPIQWQNESSIIAVTKNKNRILSGYFFLGRGKIGIQLIQETYRLGVEGNANDYASLWTNLISNMSRQKESNFKLKLTTAFPFYPHEPIDFTVFSDGLMPSLFADSIRIAMKESALVDDYWTGRSWNDKSGWHQLQIKQDSTQTNYFVSDSSEWKSLKISDQIMNNHLYQKVLVNNAKGLFERVAISPFVFYFIFLASSAFLWLAPKI